MKTYKHLAVPPGVDRNLEALRVALARGVQGCIFSTTSCPIVGIIGCTGIKCPNCICDRAHRDLLKEYLNKVEKENSMTEEQLKAILKPGMIIRTTGGDHYLWIGGGRDESYRLGLFEGPECSPNHIVIEDNCTDFAFDTVEVVFSDDCPGGPSVRGADLYAILEGRRTLEFTTEVWRRPKPAKEMTVDEISKALGYKVKVVGNEQADD